MQKNSFLGYFCPDWTNENFQGISSCPFLALIKSCIHPKYNNKKRANYKKTCEWTDIRTDKGAFM